MTLHWVFRTIPVFLREYLITLKNLLPYLVIGILISELLKFTSWTKIISKWVSKSPFIAVVAASVIGMVSPLCTYGTLPVVMELYRNKVHIAPLIAFLAASSLINPQLFIMTAGGIEYIGLEIAITLTIAVAIICIVLGLLMYLVPVKYIIRKNIPLHDDRACTPVIKGTKLTLIKQYFINCLKNLKHIGVYLLIGIFLGVFIDFYIPTYTILELLGEGQKVRSILLASLMGVPLYACGGGAVPLVNRLIQNGMGKGAGLAFFIVGSATRPAPLSAMATLFTPLFLVAYCVFLIGASVVMGIFY